MLGLPELKFLLHLCQFPLNVALALFQVAQGDTYEQHSSLDIDTDSAKATSHRTGRGEGRNTASALTSSARTRRA
jgi:hypothetical protein